MDATHYGGLVLARLEILIQKGKIPPCPTNQTNLTDARNNLADICAQVVADREVMMITQPDGANLAPIAADELES